VNSCSVPARAVRKVEKKREMREEVADMD